jgi:hypothetical protein
VIEWENAILAAKDRPAKMLGSLSEEFNKIDFEIETIFLFDPGIIDGAKLKSDIDLYLVSKLAEPSSVRIKLEHTNGRHYYEIKNYGASIATGEIVVFLDSDVIPLTYWFKNLLEPFSKYPDCDVVAGASHIESNGLIGGAFSLGWFFPTYYEVKPAKYTSHFFANNVAFRRSFFLKNPFPRLENGATRGACVSLAQHLNSLGIPIYFQADAKVLHPAPNGLNHFIVRGLAEGRDHAIRYFGKTKIKQVRGALTKIKEIFTRALKVGAKGIRYGRALHISYFSIPILMMIMFAYYSLVAFGFCLVLLAPNFFRSAWRI